ncbi:MAG: dihydroorotate dehydrogenase electron transfer subunit [Candidatus Omnitrophica bacterium]|nr:dihydroorotate dehydrogenase electron transfer subunit [Candidatus Omnitrophota bacterium]MDD5592504.1 dihydroorotate dehydrogenase electron transfer subunit [Candidatus Omnitrophota bacterium]
MLQIKAKILYNKRIKGNYFQLVLGASQIAKEAQPGQFVNIRVNGGAFEPLLRRPFSIHKASRGSIEILYEVLGEATQILSTRKAGEYSDVIGPLGHGFNYSLQLTAYSLRILVAGGMGVAPLLFLAEKIQRCQSVPACPAGRKVSKYQSMVLIGAKTKYQLFCEKEFKDLGCAVKIATDDGSRGFKGKVTELLKHILPTTNDQRPTTIYACGPRPMLKQVALISQKHKIPGQISLEEHLACGIGACLGCVVNTTGGFQRVCKEGPVFSADSIIWSNEDETYGAKRT